MTLCTDDNKFHGFLKKSAFYLTVRNLPRVQVEHISGYLDNILEFGELEFPSDPTTVNKTCLYLQVRVLSLGCRHCCYSFRLILALWGPYSE